MKLINKYFCFFTLILIIAIPSKLLGQNEVYLIIMPVIKDIKGDSKLRPDQVFLSACVQTLKIKNNKHEPRLFLLDTLFKIKKISNKLKYNAYISSFFIGPKKVEITVYNYSIDTEKIVGYSKSYELKSEVENEAILFSILSNKIKEMDSISVIPYNAESEFIAITSEVQGEITEKEINSGQFNSFEDYDIHQIKSTSSIKLAIKRINYYLQKIDKTFPFKEYPNTIAQPLIDHDISLNEMEYQFPHSYAFLKASEFMNQYLRLTRFKNVNPVELKLRKDSMDKWINILDSLVEVKFISDTEFDIWKQMDTTFEECLSLFAKVKNKNVDDCEFIIDQLNNAEQTLDINLRIKNTLVAIKERCGGTRKQIVDLNKMKYLNKFDAMMKLDTLSVLNLMALKLADENYLNGYVTIQKIKNIELPKRQEIEAFLSATLKRYVNSSHTEFKYELEINGNSIKLKYYMTDNGVNYNSFMNGYPLGSAHFDGSANYFDFVLTSLKDIQNVFNVQLTSLTVSGDSDASPFSQTYEMKIENDKMLNIQFNIIHPIKKSVQLKSLDLKRSNFDKNVALAFKRGYYLQQYLIKNGFEQGKFKPINVRYHEGNLGKEFRKSDITATFTLQIN